MRWSWLIMMAAVGGALAAAGCAPAPAPATDEVGPPRAALPDLTPTLYVPPLYGTTTPWPLSEALAQELLQYDIAVATQSGHGASYVLYSLAEAGPAAGGRYDVTIYWDLVSPRGELIGTVSQDRTMNAEAWQDVPPDLQALAAEAAARIVHILPGAQWEPTDPALKIAAHEERRKLEERRRLYRKMATRGGLGPLSRRIFLHAELLERRAADSARLAAARDEESAPLAAAPVEEIGIPSAPLAIAPAAGRPVVVDEPVDLGDGHFAELGAFPDEADARLHWQQLRRAHADLFVGRGVVLTPVELDGRGTFYRVNAGPFETQPEAAVFCEALAGSGVRCVVPLPADGPEMALTGGVRVIDIPEPLAITVPSAGGG